MEGEIDIRVYREGAENMSSSRAGARAGGGGGANEAGKRDVEDALPTAVVTDQLLRDEEVETDDDEEDEAETVTQVLVLLCVLLYIFVVSVPFFRAADSCSHFTSLFPQSVPNRSS